MNILINCNSIKLGGGLQVADSVCRCLIDLAKYSFVVVLSKYMDATANRIKDYPNVTVVRYDENYYDLKTVFLGRDKVMDTLVEDHHIDAVLTIFGPTEWSPRCYHVCGFARSQLVLRDSPYYQQMAWLPMMKEKLQNKVLKYFFGRGVDVFWTENPYISDKVEDLFPKKKVVTVTNYYNQMFDQPEKWQKKELPPFDGVTMLSVNTPYPHKNMGIALGTAKALKAEHPDFKFRFVMTINESDYPKVPDEFKQFFVFTGKVDICEVPSLYQQADICFQPTLLECFSATYPEAMRMEMPIVTTDIEFARGLCGNAAMYYSALDPKAAASAIYKVASDKMLWETLVAQGKEQIKTYDTYGERARKLIEIAVSLVEKK